MFFGVTDRLAEAKEIEKELEKEKKERIQKKIEEGLNPTFRKPKFEDAAFFNEKQKLKDGLKEAVADAVTTEQASSSKQVAKKFAWYLHIS